jgi:hypothetical protein
MFSPSAPIVTVTFANWFARSIQPVLIRLYASSLFGAGKAVLRPVARDRRPGARARRQGTKTLAQLGGLPA